VRKQEVIEVVDTIKLPKVISSISTEGRVREANRRNTNMNQRQFGKQLKEEEARASRQDDEEQGDVVVIEDKKRKKEHLPGAKASTDLADDQEDDNEQKPGKLVDIVV